MFVCVFVYVCVCVLRGRTRARAFVRVRATACVREEGEGGGGQRWRRDARPLIAAYCCIQSAISRLAPQPRCALIAAYCGFKAQ